MLQSLDHSTCSNYRAGLLHFTQFCNLLALLEEFHMPASSELISLFSAHHTGHTSEKILNNWLTGLHFWHIINSAPWHRDDMLCHVHRGFMRLIPPSSKHAKCPPVTIETLCILHNCLDLANTFDASVWALASVAFWSCCCLGELLIPSQNVFDPSKHVSRQVLPLSISSLDNGTHHSTFHIPWCKTTLTLGADISVTSHNHHTCPLLALLNHCTGSLGIPPDAPLFAFRTSSGWSPMTHPWFLNCCNQVWVSAGFADMPRHAFCIGGATELLLQGVLPDVVTTQGRWKSQAFLDYWHQINSILPLFISLSANSTCLLSLNSIMDNFACHTNLCTVPSHS
ncbi:hypothetical protein M404DRAFT_133542 [Pisolithus tinctorius Marx 270]|uniref:Uncharacterized protein n=1 Tax=Pisolithus tinctorius Marx 270 TaxID=870435 RepID=A0A0C3PJX2_PISTI|nr:hypothetical protein M404DRAFT_133542 [Pisolithus tinctorius Marx 270]